MYKTKVMKTMMYTIKIQKQDYKITQKSRNSEIIKPGNSAKD